VEQDVRPVRERDECRLVLERAVEDPTAERAQRGPRFGPARESGDGVAPGDQRLDEVRADEAGGPGDRRLQIGLS
jgi:hypothetical protein